MALLAETAMSASVMVFMLAVLLVSFLLLTRTQRYFNRQAQRGPSGATSPPAQTSDDPMAPHGQPPEELVRWQVQMQEAERELSGILDSKMAVLQQLIREADRAAARLEAACAAAGRPVSSPEAGGIVGRTPPSQANGLHGPRQEGQAARTHDSAEDPVSRAPAPEKRFDEIYLLSDYGYPPEEIAQRVGSPVGEVELILSLRKKR